MKRDFVYCDGVIFRCCFRSIYGGALNCMTVMSCLSSVWQRFYIIFSDYFLGDMYSNYTGNLQLVVFSGLSQVYIRGCAKLHDTSIMSKLSEAIFLYYSDYFLSECRLYILNYYIK